MTLGRAGGRTRRVKVRDDPAATLSAYPRPIRQLAVTGLGHDQPTLLITNQAQLPARQVIQSYARRMNIEQRLAEAIQSFGLDALAGAVPLNVDLDVVLSVLAHTVCAALRRRLPGYSTATPDTLQRRFLNTGGIITSDRDQITVRLNRRTYSPILRQATLPETITVPWWEAAPSATSTPDPDWGPIRLVKIGVSPAACSAKVTAGHCGFRQRNRRTRKTISTGRPPAAPSATVRAYPPCTRADSSPHRGQHAESARHDAAIITATPASSTRCTRSPAKCGNSTASKAWPCSETSQTTRTI